MQPKSARSHLISSFPRTFYNKVHRAPNGTYEGALAVLSPDLVLFLKRDTPCLELCRVTTSPGSSDGDDAPSATLQVMRTLALPTFHPDYHVHTAYMQTDRYSPCQSGMEAALHQQPQRQRPTRAPAALTFHSAPEDMVVGITFLLRFHGPGPHLQHGPRRTWKKVVTTISHRALFALAATGSSSHETCGEDDDAGEEDLEQEEEEGEEEGGEETVPVPWEEWGPRSTRVISPPAFHWITAHAGQRWLSLEDDKLVVRDFSAARVRRARARAEASGAPSDSTTYLRHQTGDGTGAVLAPAQTRIPGGSACFREDVTSELPFLETRVDSRGRVGDMVLTDGERLISFVRVVSSFPQRTRRGGEKPEFLKKNSLFFFGQGQPPTFEVYVLDEDDEQEQEQEWESGMYG